MSLLRAPIVVRKVTRCGDVKEGRPTGGCLMKSNESKVMNRNNTRRYIAKVDAARIKGRMRHKIWEQQLCIKNI